MFVLVAILGASNRNYDPHSSPMRTFFNRPAMESSSYTLIVAAMFAASALLFVLTWMTGKNRDA
jgi:hypothetical protein